MSVVTYQPHVKRRRRQAPSLCRLPSQPPRCSPGAVRHARLGPFRLPGLTATHSAFPRGLPFPDPVGPPPWLLPWVVTAPSPWPAAASRRAAPVPSPRTAPDVWRVLGKCFQMEGPCRVPPPCSWPPLPTTHAHVRAVTLRLVQMRTRAHAMLTCPAHVPLSRQPPGAVFPGALAAASLPAQQLGLSPGGCGLALNASLPSPPLPCSRDDAASVRRRAEEGDLLRVGQPAPEDSGFAGATP